jgi:hypothetical protein
LFNPQFRLILGHCYLHQMSGYKINSRDFKTTV